MTPQELRAKLGKEITGDSSFDGSPSAYAGASADDQVKITNAMKAYIRANPAGFSPTAQSVALTPDISPIEHYTVGQAVADFGDEFANQAIKAGEDIASVGKGVLNTFKLGSWLIPTAAVVVLGIAVYGFYLKQKK
jgi:uncharacterized membrane protein